MYNIFFIILGLLLPIISGIFLLSRKDYPRKKRQILVFSTLLIASAINIGICLTSTEATLTIFEITQVLTLAFKVDGLSQIFVIMVSLLWLITTIYAFEYMKHEGKEDRFFSFFIMSYPMVIGLGYAANLFTLYSFYEFITFITLPLVIHQLNGKARYAGKIYIEYMMLGASLAFIGLIFVLNFELHPTFTFGGILNETLANDSRDALLLVFLLASLGFGVKAAVFPLHKWLPTASVAPTPVTALLHAVAVVNAGAFAMIRLIYYTFGVDFLQGSWAQSILIILASITIVYGSFMALKTKHIKRRLAYSTISNLSYIVLSISLMSTSGLIGGVTQMIYHSIIKMTLFFVAGNILYQTGKEYIHEIGGYAHKMKLTFTAFLISGLGLMGVPPLIGFAAKYIISESLIHSTNIFATIGFASLLLSSFLTTLYIMEIFIKGFVLRTNDDVKEANNYMKIPLILLVTTIIIMSFSTNNLHHLLESIIGGVH